MTTEIIISSGPPINAGTIKNPKLSTKTSSDPAIMPGTVSGKKIWKNEWIGLPPNPSAANCSLGSIPFMTAYKLKNINGYMT